MPVTGTPAFNAIALLNIDPISFRSNDIELVAHGAFINTDTGNTYGKTTCRRWSKQTLEKLLELRALMEEDLAAMVFTQSSSPGPQPQQVDPGGIGEDLRGQGDAPQV